MNRTLMAAIALAMLLSVPLLFGLADGSASAGSVASPTPDSVASASLSPLPTVTVTATPVTTQLAFQPATPAPHATKSRPATVPLPTPAAAEEADVDGSIAGPPPPIVTITSPTTIGAGDTQYDGSVLTVDGTTFTIEGPHSFASLDLVNSAVLTVARTNAPTGLTIDVGTLTVDATSRIDVTGKGYLGARQSGSVSSTIGTTFGNTTTGGSYNLAGGGYGGLGGGSISGATSNAVYGDFQNPAEPGSGGGGYAPCCGVYVGGNGGGAVQITATSITLDGDILANGTSGGGANVGGGGSGGAVLITTSTLTGTGSISADGGNSSIRGGGGGGRIALYYGSIGLDPASITAVGGSGNQTGGAGTIFLKNSGPVSSITGTITDNTGSGLVGASMTYWGPGCAACDGGLTSANGAYELTGLIPGLYRIRVDLDGYTGLYYSTTGGVAQYLQSTLVTAISDQTTFGIDIQLLQTGAINGTVRNETGTPLTNAIVIAEQIPCCAFDTATSDGSGAFAIVDLPPGDYRIRASAIGYATEHYTAAGGVPLPFDAETVVVVKGGTATGIDFSLAGIPELAISPTALELAIVQGSVSPPVSFSVTNVGTGTATNVTVDPAPFIDWMIVDVANLGNLEPGQSAVVELRADPPAGVSPGTYRDSILAIADNAPAAASALVQTTVGPAATGDLTFRVLNESGNPIVGADVSVSASEPVVHFNAGQISYSFDTASGETNAVGEVTFQGLTDGGYTYTAAASGFQPEEGLAALAGTQLVEVNMAASPLDIDFSVERVTIEDQYEVTLEITYGADLPTPRLAASPLYFCFDFETYPEYSDAITVFNPSSLRIDNIQLTDLAFDTTVVFANGGSLGSLEAGESRSIGITATGTPGNGDDGVIAISGTYLAVDPATITPENPTGDIVEFTVHAVVGVLLCPPPPPPSEPPPPTAPTLRVVPERSCITFDGFSIADRTFDITNTGLFPVFGVTAVVESDSLPSVHVSLEESFFGTIGPGETVGAVYHATDGSGTASSVITVSGNYTDPSSGITSDTLVVRAPCPVPPPNPPSPCHFFDVVSSLTISCSSIGPTPPPELLRCYVDFSCVRTITRFRLQQSVTLEREAFLATLNLGNSSTSAATNIQAQLLIFDSDGNDAVGNFIIGAPTNTGIDGAGTLPGPSEGSIEWLIGPDLGAGGTDGRRYLIQSLVSYDLDGSHFDVESGLVPIDVTPEPKLTLDYYLPGSVLPNEPFFMGLIVSNDGFGPAQNVCIDSAQPEIVENVSGTALNFQIHSGAVVGGPRLGTDSLEVCLGDVPPDDQGKAFWLMTVDAEGEFLEFEGSFEHVGTQGLPLPSLIDQVRTHIVRGYQFALSCDPTDTLFYQLIDQNRDTSFDHVIAMQNLDLRPVQRPGIASIDSDEGSSTATVHLNLVNEELVYLDLIGENLPFPDRSVIEVRTGGGQLICSWWESPDGIHIVGPPSNTYVIKFTEPFERPPSGSGQRSHLDRKVIVVKGIWSEGADQSDCGKRWDEIDAMGDLWTVRSRLLERDVISYVELNEDVVPNTKDWEDFYGFSYSGEYCTGLLGDHVPVYSKSATCTGIDEDGQAADRLREKLKDIWDKDPGAEFDIIAHSMGGLVTAFMIAELMDENPRLLSRIRSVTTLDSPLQGIGGIGTPLDVAHLTIAAIQNARICLGETRSLEDIATLRLQPFTGAPVTRLGFFGIPTSNQVVDTVNAASTRPTNYVAFATVRNRVDLTVPFLAADLRGSFRDEPILCGRELTPAEIVDLGVNIAGALSADPIAAVETFREIVDSIAATHSCVWDDGDALLVIADMVRYTQIIDDRGVRADGWDRRSDLPDRTYKSTSTRSHTDGIQASVSFTGREVVLGFLRDCLGFVCASKFKTYIDGNLIGGTRNDECSWYDPFKVQSCRIIIGGLSGDSHELRIELEGNCCALTQQYFHIDYIETRQARSRGGAVDMIDSTTFLVQDHTSTVAASVPEGTESVSIHIGPVGSRAETTLVAPDGTEIGPDTTDPNVDYSRTESDEFYTIQNPQPGDWILRIFGADMPPEGEWVSVQVTVTFPEDTTPPTTTVTLAGEQAPNGWYTDDVTVSFAATDDFSGVAQTDVSLDGGASWAVAGGPVVFDQPGKNDLLVRSVDFAGNTEEPVAVSFSIGRPTELTNVGPFAGQYSDAVTLEVRLVDLTDGSPVAAEPVGIMLGTKEPSPVPVTDSTGTAFATFLLDQPSGTQSWASSYEGDGVRLASEDTDDFLILKEEIETEYTGDQVVPVTDDSLTLRAIVLEEQDGSLGDIALSTVEFSIYRMTDDSLVMTYGPIGVIPASGLPGVGTAEAIATNLPEGDYYVVVAPASENAYYGGPPAAPAALTVYEPTGPFVTGGGRVDLDDGSRSTFSLNIRYNRRLTNVRGRSNYIFQQDGLNYFVKSNRLDGFVVQDNVATVQGRANIKTIDPATGEEVEIGGNFTFLVRVVDNGEPGENDTYEIVIRDRDGLVYHQVSLRNLAGGNILIHD